MSGISILRSFELLLVKMYVIKYNLKYIFVTFCGFIYTVMP